MAVTIGDKNIYEMTEMSVRDLRQYLDELQLTETQLKIGKEILKEIKGRLQFLVDVGLDYLSLSRATELCQVERLSVYVWQLR